MMFFVLLTVIYWTISKIIPKPFRKLFQRIPPFPILKQFGIFDLVGGIFGVIFSNSKFLERVEKTAYIFGAYIERNTTEFLKLMGINSDIKPTIVPPAPEATAVEPSREETLRRNPDAEDPPIFGRSDARKADDEYRQCIEENIISAPPDTSVAALQSIKAKNTISRTVCKAKYLNSYLEDLKFMV
jgi:hypothetical protein